jgi:methionine biosynthesis protein MetW
MELDARDVATAVARGLSVVQGDADTDLADYPDGSFDYAILSQTLQTTKRPDLVLDHLVRIGRQAFVSFPNFAQWRIRFAHMFGGRMPVTEQLPHRWYDTPNIHHVTIDDFRSFLDERNIRIEGQWFLSGDKPRDERLANLLAEHAVFLLRRD